MRIRVEAFGLNRSELELRLGLSVGVSFPRVPGIEAAGTVDAAPAGSGLVRGQQVAAMMGGMGRTYDGGYAEYTSVPLSQRATSLAQAGKRRPRTMLRIAVLRSLGGGRGRRRLALGRCEWGESGLCRHGWVLSAPVLEV